MQELQTVLDYAAIAPILITVGLFCEYCWRRSSPAAALVRAEVPDESAIADLLAIPPTPPPTEVLDCALVPLGKLYAVPGSSKWGKSRRLRESEKRAVLQAIAA